MDIDEMIRAARARVSGARWLLQEARGWEEGVAAMREVEAAERDLAALLEECGMEAE